MLVARVACYDQKIYTETVLASTSHESHNCMDATIYVPSPTRLCRATRRRVAALERPVDDVLILAGAGRGRL